MNFFFQASTHKLWSSWTNRNDSFFVKVELPNGLITNQKQLLPFKNNLLASAEVITKEKRLMESFTGKIYEILKR